MGPPDRAAIAAQTGVPDSTLTQADVDLAWQLVPRFVMCVALPFEYHNAPWLFQKIMRTVAQAIRSLVIPAHANGPEIRGVTCMVYLDDWLVLTPSQAEMWRVRPAVETVLAAHGIFRQL